MMKSSYLILILVFVLISVNCKKFTDENKPEWAKKDIRDFNDADMERLLDQWEVSFLMEILIKDFLTFTRIKLMTLVMSTFQEDEEPLEDDELPEHLRPQPKIDMSQIDMSNPENLLKMTKKGRTVMSFVQVSGNPTRDEAEEITKIWQTGLWNSHIQAER